MRRILSISPRAGAFLAGSLMAVGVAVSLVTSYDVVSRPGFNVAHKTRSVASLGFALDADVAVILHDKSEVFISDLRAGDRLLGQGQANAVREIKRQTLFGERVYALDSSPYFVTAEQAFWTPQGWKAIEPLKTLELNPDFGRISTLRPGDLLWRMGKWERLKAIQEREEGPGSSIHRLRLDGDHTYFANGYLVRDHSAVQ